MKAYLIAIGDELLSGRTLDTNSNYIALELDKIGVYVSNISIIADKPEIIKKELEKAFRSEADFIFTTGGLGPTKDDKTKQVITEFLSDELIIHEPTLEHIKNLYAQRKRVLNELSYNQALVPSRTQVIINKYGTAPVMWTEKDDKVLINLPGVPFETQGMVSEFIIPKIKQEYKLGYIVRKSVTVVDIPESELAIRLEDWESNLPSFISLAYLPSASRIELRLTSIGEDQLFLEDKIQEEIQKLSGLLGNNMIPVKEKGVENMIARILTEKLYTLAVAESLTGGALSGKIVSVAGSSAYYKGGIIAYNTQIKQDILTVSPEIINENTVVSEQVAVEMAKQVARMFNADIGLATTGVAGPASDEFNNPVGLAYVALYLKGKIFSEKIYYPNITREEMINRITNKVLDILYFKLIE